ncbi:Fc.00g070770.m01.CDS01 [Cosmosporella sp. VM-42]
MASSQTSKQRLALAICDFLSTSTTDGTLTADDKDSIDVAINCIADSFKVDPSDAPAIQAALGSQNLLQIYSVYEKLKSGSDKPAPSTQVTEDQKKQAEALKSKGNAAMAQKDYGSAIELYTQALGLNPTNAVFLSNRAAAHSAAKDHTSAKADAEAAVAIDPAYTKAWSRLGLARFALGDAQGAMEAYGKGIEYEGNGGSDAMKKGFETAKRRVEDMQREEESLPRSSPGVGGAPGGMPDLGSLASMLGGAGGPGGAGGAGGMPDLGSIMNNPMFASMAQSLMSNPDMMSNLMSNPRLRQMADQFSSGGGMPDLNSLMSDPNIADMARNMMGGGGPPGGAPGGDAPGTPGGQGQGQGQGQ